MLSRVSRISAAPQGHTPWAATDHTWLWARAGALSCGSRRSAAPQGLISGVPTGALVMLDLYADVNPQWARTDGFYGAPFIWCMLHNFGGNLGARRAALPAPGARRRVCSGWRVHGAPGAHAQEAVSCGQALL